MPAFQDLTGRRFTKLVVIRRGDNTLGGTARWVCRCDCGAESLALAANLKKGHTQSCGCLRRDSIPDLTGMRFTRLQVLERAPNRKGATMWSCKCDCGALRAVHAASLLNKSTHSCGCYKTDFRRSAWTTHGGTHTSEHKTWLSILQRTTNPKLARFPRYGGRGITVCDRWKTNFQNFLDDMGPKPSPSHSIERRDNDGNYAPENCYWATPKEQASNRRSTVWLEYKGETKCMKSWSETLGIEYGILCHRISGAKWSVEKAFETPVKKRKL